MAIGTEGAARRSGEPHAPRAAPFHERLGPLLENVGESGAACLLTMLQGNLFAMTAGHWVIAAQTGFLSGALATAALLLAGSPRRRWIAAAVLAAATFGVDLFRHPSSFGGVATEAVVTGVGAAALSLAVGKVLARRRPAAPA